jgi:hypothetical protein
MKLSESPAPNPGRWTSLWVVALISLVAQLALCQFFTFGEMVPVSLDINPSKLWTLAYHFPPTGTFQTLNWLGVPYYPQPLNPLSLAAAHLSSWLFFTAYVPVLSTLALLAMAAFLRELELSRPAAIFGGVIYAWQGDILPFVFPGHYGYITFWPFFAIAAWGALRSQRTGHWAYAVISGVCCGIMVGLLTNADRGGIASLMIAALYLAPLFRRTLTGPTTTERLAPLRHLALCVAVAGLVALAPLLALFKGNIEDVKLAGTTDREQTYKLVTQFSLGPFETLTYLVPGFFGWHMHNSDGPYWGWIGEWPDWPKNHQGTRNLNLAISTTGTVATALAFIGILLLLPGEWMGPARLSERQRFFARFLLALGFIALILSWGWHTPFYRPLFGLPLMDKWRNPLKWIEVTNFSLVVLGAFGVHHLLRSVEIGETAVKDIRRRLGWFTVIMIGLLLGGLLFSYPLAIAYASQFQADGFDPHLIPNMMNTMHTSLIWAVLLMGLFGGVLLLLWRPDPLRGVKFPNPWLQRFWQSTLQPENLPLTLALAMAVLSAVQLGWVTTQFIDPVPIVTLTQSYPLLDALRTDTNDNNVRCSVVTDDQILGTLLQNQFAAMNISCLDISAASRIPDRLNTFFETVGGDHTRLWFLTGVKDVVVPQQFVAQMHQDPSISPNIDRADGYTLAQPSSSDVPSHALVILKDYLAKATFVPGVDLLSESDTLARLKDPAWNPRDKILLQKPATISVPPAVGPAGTSDTVEIGTYTPTEITIDTKTSRSGFVLIDDYYDPDWQVQVNGHDEPLLRADYLLRAVAIPAGESRITMRYVAHYSVAGHPVSAEAMNLLSDGAMLAAWLIAGLALRRRSS